MRTRVHIENIFPTPIYNTVLELENYDFSNIKFISQTNDVTVISDTNDLLNQSQFASLKSQIDDHMQHFYYNILGYEESIRPEMCSSWLVRTSPNHESAWHVHKNSIFSGVLYLNTDKDCGNIIFKVPETDDRNIIPVLDPPIKFQSIYNHRWFSVAPKNGLMLLFLSTLPHKIQKNCSNIDRLSIAFNYFLKGSFDDAAGRLTLS